MAVDPNAPIQSAPTSEAGPKIAAPTGEALSRAVDAPGGERLRLQAEVYAHHNDISLSQALSALPLEARLEIMKGQWEASQSFFASWAASIRENGIADRASSAKATERAQQVALQARNAEIAQRATDPSRPPVARREDGLAPPRQVGVLT